MTWDSGQIRPQLGNRSGYGPLRAPADLAKINSVSYSLAFGSSPIGLLNLKTGSPVIRARVAWPVS